MAEKLRNKEPLSERTAPPRAAVKVLLEMRSASRVSFDEISATRPVLLEKVEFYTAKVKGDFK